MDRFKFRVWDGEKMEYNVYQFECLKNEIMMQSTGLKDKNGKLIFEGDIVQEEIIYDNEDGKEITEYDKHIIVFQDCAFQFALNCDYNNLESIFPMQEMVSETLEDIEIIGNIYENLELLNNI